MSDVQQESPAVCSSCGTGCLDGINCWKVSCKFDSTGKQLVKVKVKDDEGVWSEWAVATVYVAEVTNVEWVKYDSSYLDLGQNVLYKDGSVMFQRSPQAGIGGDNIYTYDGYPPYGDGDPVGTGPGGNGNGGAAYENDSYLVSEKNERN